LLAGVGGLAAAVAIYLAFNLGGPSTAGWGVAMASDTALGLGLLAVAAPRAPQRLRAFVLTVLVVTDVVALAVIGAVYSHDLDVAALACAVAFVAMTITLGALGLRSGIPCALLGVAGGWRCSSQASSRWCSAWRWACCSGLAPSVGRICIGPSSVSAGSGSSPRRGRSHYGPYDIASLSAAVRAEEAHGRLESLEAREPKHDRPHASLTH
jgi:hypothetical protein